MSDEASFRDLMRRVRAGEEEAAAQVIQRFEPTIRRIVHVRMRDPRLRRCFDSEDICQSVLRSFFVRAAMGQYELDTPEQLLRLLATMAKNKVINQAKHHRAERRDHRRTLADSAEIGAVTAAGSTASEHVAAAEILDQVRGRLTPEEHRLVELRQQGRNWPQIAREVGGSADGLRIKFSRALNRIAQELGLIEVPDE